MKSEKEEGISNPSDQGFSLELTPSYKGLILLLMMWKCVGIVRTEQCLWKLEEGVKSPGAGVISSPDLPDEGSEPVSFFKNSGCF